MDTDFPFGLRAGSSLLSSPAQDDPNQNWASIIADALSGRPSASTLELLPSPPTPDVIARADPLTRLGFSVLHPYLFDPEPSPSEGVASPSGESHSPDAPSADLNPSGLQSYDAGGSSIGWLNPDPYDAAGIAPPSSLRHDLPDTTRAYPTQQGAAAETRAGQPSGRSRGLWVSGQYYRPDQIGAAAAALRNQGPASPTGLTPGPGNTTVPPVAPPVAGPRASSPHRNWLDDAQRQVWLTLSDHTADNAGDFASVLAREVWNDLPGWMPELGLQPRVAGAAKAAEQELLEAVPYKELVRRLQGTGIQAHHLNQDAAYGSKILHSEGLAIPLRGNAFSGPGTPHFDFHQAMEEFWELYRGELLGQLPTNAQYGAAMERALLRAGVPRSQAASYARQAAAQRLAHGLEETADVPRVPGRLAQARGR